MRNNNTVTINKCCGICVWYSAPCYEVEWPNLSTNLSGEVAPEIGHPLFHRINKNRYTEACTKFQLHNLLTPITINNGK